MTHRSTELDLSCPPEGLKCKSDRACEENIDAAFLALPFWLPLTAPAQAQVDPGLLQAVKALQGGGHVIVFRHGATHADQADTDPLNIANVAKQRQLNDQGRALAREIGEAMRKLKIPVGQVITSQFNRAVETGSCSASAT